MYPEPTTVRHARKRWVQGTAATAILVLALGVPGSGVMAADPAKLAETNADQFGQRVVSNPLGIVSSPPLQVKGIWNDFTYYLQHFVIGWELEISEDSVVPVDVTLPTEYGMIEDPRADDQCQLSRAGVGEGPPSAGMSAGSDKPTYRVYPKLWVKIADRLHVSLPKKIFIILEGTAAASSDAGVDAPALDCVFYVPLIVTNQLQEFVLNLTANVHSIPTPPVSLAFGTFTGSGQNVDHQALLPNNQSTPVALVGFQPAFNFSGIVEAAYTGDTGMDWHDDDYMKVQWDGGDNQLTAKGGPGQQSHHSPKYPLSSGEADQFCVEARAYDDDSLNGDDVADSEQICAWVSYTQVQPDAMMAGTPLGECLQALDGVSPLIDVATLLQGQPCYDVECIDEGQKLAMAGRGVVLFGYRKGGRCAIFVDDRQA